jgi:hypothetical protein
MSGTRPQRISITAQRVSGVDDFDVGAGNDIQPAPDRDAMGRSDHRNRQRSPTPGDLLWHVGQPMSPGHQIHGLAVVTKI